MQLIKVYIYEHGIILILSFARRAGPPPQQRGPINVHGPVLPDLPNHL